MGPKFISPESMKNIACVVHKISKGKSPCDLLNLGRKLEAQFRLLGPVGGSAFNTVQCCNILMIKLQAMIRVLSNSYFFCGI